MSRRGFRDEDIMALKVAMDDGRRPMEYDDREKISDRHGIRRCFAPCMQIQHPVGDVHADRQLYYQGQIDAFVIQHHSQRPVDT